MKLRERLTSSFSLRGNRYPRYTCECARTVFVELFCTPKSSMENPSLRLSGHVSSMNRTFIVEDYVADDFGQLAKGEVTGEQGYIDDERSCFWTWDDTECAWQSRPLKGRQVKKKKRKGKRKKAKYDPEGPEEHSLVMHKRKIPNGGKKRTEFGGPKERKGKKSLSKRQLRSSEGWLSPVPVRQRCRQGFSPKQWLSSIWILSLRKHPIKKDMARPKNQTIGLPLQMLGGSVPSLILLGWWELH